MRRLLSSFRAVTGLDYGSVPPPSLNELPDQGTEALIDLIVLIQAACEWPSLIGSSSLQRQQAHLSPLRHRVLSAHATAVWEASDGEGFFWAICARRGALCLGTGGLKRVGRSGRARGGYHPLRLSQGV